MFCPKCGKELPDGAKFCSHCGKPTVIDIPEKKSCPNDSEPPAKKTKHIKAVIGIGFAFFIIIGIIIVLSINKQNNTPANISAPPDISATPDIPATPVVSKFPQDKDFSWLVGEYICTDDGTSYSCLSLWFDEDKPWSRSSDWYICFSIDWIDHYIDDGNYVNTQDTMFAGKLYYETEYPQLTFSGSCTGTDALATLTYDGHLFTFDTQNGYPISFYGDNASVPTTSISPKPTPEPTEYIDYEDLYRKGYGVVDIDNLILEDDPVDMIISTFEAVRYDILEFASNHYGMYMNLNMNDYDFGKSLFIQNTIPEDSITTQGPYRYYQHSIYDLDLELPYFIVESMTNAQGMLYIPIIGSVSIPVKISNGVQETKLYYGNFTYQLRYSPDGALMAERYFKIMFGDIGDKAMLLLVYETASDFVVENYNESYDMDILHKVTKYDEYNNEVENYMWDKNTGEFMYKSKYSF